MLALGNVDLNAGDQFDDSLPGVTANTIFSGAPNIPDALVPYPDPADNATAPFQDVYADLLNQANDYENPNPIWTRNPTRPLQLAIDKIQPKCHIHWKVTTLSLLGGEGKVTNVPFEHRKADVTAYWADYWLLSQDEFKKGGKEPYFNYLAYTQTIIMVMEVSADNGKTSKRFRFPHITCNTVKKVPGTPTEGREKFEHGTPNCSDGKNPDSACPQ